MTVVAAELCFFCSLLLLGSSSPLLSGISGGWSVSSVDGGVFSSMLALQAKLANLGI